MTTTEVPARLRRIRPPQVGVIALLAVAYVPLLLTRPGEVGADTKTYLYLDPGRLLSRAAWMWDTSIGAGTVTHQNIGYLWPMGPWYWLLETIGVPDWIAQRLWLGTIIAAAGLGVRFMLRELRWVGAGVTVASFAYALSPYLLHYGARISVILLPFAGLPWLIGLAARSVRTGGWRWPAVFALVTVTVGGVNATSLLLVMAGPLLWMLYAVLVDRSATWRATIAAGLRITALTLATSTWWIAGLALQGAYGIPILRYTETYATVANASTSTEILRNLGYWFFYGRDALGSWISAAERLTEFGPALVLSFLIPGLALLAAVLTRFRHRAYFALLVAVGVLVGVGAHPWDTPAPVGELFRAWTQTDAGLAFRSTPRAVPLVALGLAVFLAAGVAAIARARPQWHRLVAGALIVLICCNQWALFGGELVDRNLRRPQEIPTYWSDAARAIDLGGTDTRVLEVPGTDFASYRWGETVDPITPGLIDRPYLARELIPYGAPPSANLLNALDLPLQQGTADPAALAPVARLLGVGAILHRGDLQYERFRTPRPDPTAARLARTPGLRPTATFGDDVANRADPRLPLIDEVTLGVPPGTPRAPALSLFEVTDPLPIARTTTGTAPTLLAGDGAGIVNWAASGGLDPASPILYSATFADEPDRLRAQADEPGSRLVVTDTNRRTARRWGSVRENEGVTEQAGEQAVERDPTDNRLEVFPDAGDDGATVSEQVGGAVVQASSYGNPVSYTPADRAARALDGDPSTAWRVAAFGEPRGEYLEITTPAPVTTDHVVLLQPQRAANRWITEVELHFDDSEPVVTALDDRSRIAPGQRIDVGSRTFDRLRITITETDVGRLDRYVGISDVGLAEVTIPGVAPVTEIVRPPVDLLRTIPPEVSLARPLSYVFQRRAADPAEVVVGDEESRMFRWVEGPNPRSATVSGTVRIDPDRDAPAIDALLGLPTPERGGVTVRASSSLPGDPWSRATSGIDGRSDTAWQTPVGDPRGQWIEVTSATPIRSDGLDLVVRRDGRHSLPTRLTVTGDDGTSTTVDVPWTGSGPGTDDGTTNGATEQVRVPLPVTESRTVRVQIDEVDEATSTDWFTGSPTVLPVGIVELGLGPVAEVPDVDTTWTSGCRDDLIRLDGTPVPVTATGTVGDLLGRAPVAYRGCDPAGVTIPAGRSLLETEPGAATGLEIDSLVLTSAAGGTPGPDTLVTPPVPAPPGPATTVDRSGRVDWTFSTTGATEPYWVVLGQSLSDGFAARTADGVDLGPPTLVNGFANGWLVDPTVVGPEATIEVSWTPQRTVWVGIGLSILGVVACLALILIPRRRTTPAEARPRAPVQAALEPPWRPSGPSLPLRTAVLLAIGAGVTGWLLAGPLVGGALAVLVGIAAGIRRGQVVLRLAVPALWAAAAGFVIAKQLRNDYVVDFNWMNQFELTHAWTLLAVGALVAEPLISTLRRRNAARQSSG